MSEGLENICRVCLSFEGNFYPLEDGLDYLFSQLTGLQAKSDNRLPPNLCEKCSNDLRSLQQFQLTSKQSNYLLYDVLMRYQYITKHFIETVRKENLNISVEIKVEHEDDQDKNESNNPVQDEFKYKHNNINSDSDTDLGDIFTQSAFTTDNETATHIDATKINARTKRRLQSHIVATATHNDATATDIDATKRNARTRRRLQSHIVATATHINATATDFDANTPDIDGTKINAKTRKGSQRKRKKTKKPVKSVKTAAKIDAIVKTRPQRRKRIVKPNIDKAKVPLDKRKSVTVKKGEEIVKSYFNLKYLTYEEQISNLRKRQESDNYIVAPFKCVKCYTGFLSESLFDNHMIRHSDTWGRYQCEICKARFKSKHLIRRHIVYGAHNQQFTCKNCDFVTGHKSTAIQHAQWHEGTSYQCQHCMHLFTRLSSYMNHLRVKHASEFACALCGHNFVTEKGLTQHKSRQHRLNSEIIVDGPTCTTCDIKFVSDDALNTHLRVSPKHVTENKIWSSNYTYKRGMPVTEGSQYINEYRSKKKILDAGPISCEQCGLAMENARAYYRHFRHSHPDKTRTHYPTVKTPSMCDVCGRIFQSITHLNHHITRHTGEKPFKCEECNKRFPSKVYLGMHMKRHVAKLANVSYACQMCEKTFTLACNRDKHLKLVHSDARPFSCDICGKAFKSKYEKKTHTDYVHLKKPWPKRRRQKDVGGARANEMLGDVQFEHLL